MRHFYVKESVELDSHFTLVPYLRARQHADFCNGFLTRFKEIRSSWPKFSFSEDQPEPHHKRLSFYIGRLGTPFERGEGLIVNSDEVSELSVCLHKGARFDNSEGLHRIVRNVFGL